MSDYHGAERLKCYGFSTRHEAGGSGVAATARPCLHNVGVVAIPVLVHIAVFADLFGPNQIRFIIDTLFLSAMILNVEEQRGRDDTHESATGCRTGQA